MSQERQGYDSESALHALRLRYIDMARGLPLSVIFNTTVFAANAHDIPALARFFVRHNDVVRFASFQLGADTGRGVAPGRDALAITQESVCTAIAQGAGIALNFDALQSGHRSCNRYAMAWSIGSHVFDGLADGEFAARVMRDTADVRLPRGQALEGVWALAGAVLRKRHLLGGFARLALPLLWRALGQWFSGGRVVPPIRKVSFFCPQLHGCVPAGSRTARCLRVHGSNGRRPNVDVRVQRRAGTFAPQARDAGQWRDLAAAGGGT